MKTRLNRPIIFINNDVKKLLLTMKITLFIFFLTGFQVSATNIFPQNMKISIQMRNAPVREVIKEIEHQGQMNFFYNDNLEELDNRVTVFSKDKPISEVLEYTLDQADMTYKVIKENFVELLPIGHL